MTGSCCSGFCRGDQPDPLADPVDCDHGCNGDEEHGGGAEVEIPDEAVEAACWAVDPVEGPDGHEKTREYMRAALEAAAPLIGRAWAAAERKRIADSLRPVGRRITAALLAVEHRLTEPYPDDPRWSPWARFVGPALRELRDRVDELREAPRSARDHPAGDRPDEAAQ